jgi:hypothetical protein
LLRPCGQIWLGASATVAQSGREVFEIGEQRDSFALATHRIDISELASSRPRRCRDMDDVLDAFAAKSSRGGIAEG